MEPTDSNNRHSLSFTPQSQKFRLSQSRHSVTALDTSNSEKRPNDTLFDTLMNDPVKREIVIKLLMQDKAKIEEYKQQEDNNLKKAKAKVNPSPLKNVQRKIGCESPIALLRRKALERQAEGNSVPSRSQQVITPSSLPFERLLEGVVAYVEVFSNDGDRSAGAKVLMKAMGATVKDSFTRDVTHVVFKDGSFTTYQRANLMKIHLVSVLWLEAVRTNHARVPEKNYPALGTASFNANISNFCQEMQRDYEDVVRDEVRRSLALTTPSKTRGTELQRIVEPANSPAGSSSIYHTPEKYSEDMIPASQECDAVSVISARSRNLPLKMRNLCLTPSSCRLGDSASELMSDSDSEIGLINGQTSKRIRDSTILSSLDSTDSINLQTSVTRSIDANKSTKDTSDDSKNDSTGGSASMLTHNPIIGTAEKPKARRRTLYNHTSPEYSPGPKSRQNKSRRQTIHSKINENVDVKQSSEQGTHNEGITIEGADTHYEMSKEKKTRRRTTYAKKSDNKTNDIEQEHSKVDDLDLTDIQTQLPKQKGNTRRTTLRGKLKQDMEVINDTVHQTHNETVDMEITDVVNSEHLITDKDMFITMRRTRRTPAKSTAVCVESVMNSSDASTNISNESTLLNQQRTSTSHEVVPVNQISSDGSKQNVSNGTLTTEEMSSLRLSTESAAKTNERRSNNSSKSNEEMGLLQLRVDLSDFGKKPNAVISKVITRKSSRSCTNSAASTPNRTKSVGNSEFSLLDASLISNIMDTLNKDISPAKRESSKGVGEILESPSKRRKIPESSEAQTDADRKTNRKNETSGKKKNSKQVKSLKQNTLEEPIKNKKSSSPEKFKSPTKSNTQKGGQEDNVSDKIKNNKTNVKKGNQNIKSCSSDSDSGVKNKGRKLYNLNQPLDPSIVPWPENDRQEKKKENSPPNFKKPLPLPPLGSSMLTSTAIVYIENMKHKFLTSSSSDVSSSDAKTPSKKSDTNVRKKNVKQKTISSTPSRKSTRMIKSRRSTCPDNSANRSHSDSDSPVAITPQRNRRSTLDFLPKDSYKSPSKMKQIKKNKLVKKSSIVCSRFHSPEVQEFQQIVEKLGVFFVEDNVTNKTSHLIVGESKRTVNILRAIARGCWILKSDWLHKSFEAGKWLTEEDYELTEFSSAVQQCRKQRQAFGPLYCMDIFQNCKLIYISKSTSPKFSELQELVTLCKGNVTTILRNASIVVGEFVRYEYATCVTEKWILDSVMCNKLKSLNKYLIKSERHSEEF